jgi:hypothetical protein
MNIIFLDIDGVLNHELFYEKRQEDNANFIKLPKELRDIDFDKIILLNNLCKTTNSKVVISSTWRKGNSLEKLQQMFKNVGATFEIIDKTPTSNHGVRGVEILEWTKSHSADFNNYVILDDNSDFLIWQQKHFFWVDRYCGLTPTLCYKIENFLNNHVTSIC